MRRLERPIGPEIRKVSALALVVPLTEPAGGVTGEVRHGLVGMARDRAIDFHLEDQVIELGQFDEAVHRRALHHRGHLARQRAQLAHALTSAAAVFGRRRCLVRQGLDGHLGLAGFALDRIDQFGDLIGRRGRSFGELAHFVCDHREASPLLAGSRGLDGGVEREQVGLIGDLADQLDDAADLAGPLIEFLYRSGGLAGLAGKAVEIVGDVVDRGGTVVRRIGGPGGRLLLFGKTGGEGAEGALDIAQRSTVDRQLLEQRFEHRDPLPGERALALVGVEPRPQLLADASLLLERLLQALDPLAQGLDFAARSEDSHRLHSWRFRSHPSKRASHGISVGCRGTLGRPDAAPAGGNGAWRSSVTATAGPLPRSVPDHGQCVGHRTRRKALVMNHSS